MSFQEWENGIRIPRGEAAMLGELTRASDRIVVLLGPSFPAHSALHCCIESEAFSSHPSLERVRRELFENISTPFGLHRAATLACLSPNYFSNYFHQRAGVAFWEWVDLCRIALAAALLSRNHSKIYLIAAAVGFRCADTFTRVFKREFGVTPSQFSDLCRAQRGLAASK